MTNASFPVLTASTAELLNFFNANTGGAQVKKFADRQTAERRVQALINEMKAEAPDFYQACELAAEKEEALAVASETLAVIHASVAFPKLNAAEKAKLATVELVETGHPNAKFLSAKTGPRAEQSKTMKLPRAIVDLTAGIEYKNASAVWKAGVISSSQCDRLSGILYMAAKNGDREKVAEVNGHNFTLALK